MQRYSFEHTSEIVTGKRLDLKHKRSQLDNAILT
jgi:hypothetical protein